MAKKNIDDGTNRIWTYVATVGLNRGVLNVLLV